LDNDISKDKLNHFKERRLDLPVSLLLVGTGIPYCILSNNLNIRVGCWRN